MRNEEPSFPGEADAPATRPGIGETLRATRELRRASIEYAAELLRIEPRFLVALEQERFDAIGPPVFVKGYLKHYCELLGIDPRPLLDELRERLGREEPPLQARRSAERAKGGSSLAAVGIGAVVVALAAVAVWQLGGSGPESDDEAAADVAQTEARDAFSQPAATGASRSASDGPEDPTRADVARPVGATTAEIASPDGATVGEPLAPASAVGATVQQPLAPATAVGATVQQALALPALSSSAAAEPALTIDLRFVEDSWTEVTAATGERLFYGLGRAGGEERLRTDSEVRVLLGNADGVVVSVNGEPFTYPAGSRSGDLARFRLSPEN